MGDRDERSWGLWLLEEGRSVDQDVSAAADSLDRLEGSSLALLQPIRLGGVVRLGIELREQVRPSGQVYSSVRTTRERGISD
jgi:hypothetical protein